jgi:ubiquinone/menaquinone biosynthesis C-methylase UbiE
MRPPLDGDRFARLSNPERVEELRPAGLLTEVAGVSEGMTCVDLGCGTGVFALPMADLVGLSGAVYAVDNNHDMLDYIRTQHPPPSLRLVRADATRTGLPDGIADICLLAFVLHEFKAPHEALKESRRLLRPTGKAVIVEWRMESDKGPPLEIRIPKKKAETLLAESGLTPGSYVNWSNRHYVIVGTKE